VFEVLRITRDLRPLIAAARPTSELREQAQQSSLLDLRRAALLKVARGETTAEEVLRAIPAEELRMEE
jgi:type II secretory ATPase GspE/PulE/Tfp pilus assembly ATPase PilB-like protein